MRKWIWIVGVLILIGGGIAAAAYLREDPQVAKVREMQESIRFGDDVSRDERRTQFEQLRTEVGKLSDTQRRDLFEGRREDMMRRMEARLDEFFTLSHAERMARLDEEIDRAEEFRERFANRGGGRGRRERRPEGDSNASNENRGGEGDRGRGGRGGWGRGRNRGPDNRDARTRGFLDNTSPNFRAKSAEYRRLMRERREARGLDGGGFRGGFPGGPGGGRGPGFGGPRA